MPEGVAEDAVVGKVPCVPVKGRTAGSFFCGRFVAFASGEIDFEAIFEETLLVGALTWEFDVGLEY